MNKLWRKSGRFSQIFCDIVKNGEFSLISTIRERHYFVNQKYKSGKPTLLFVEEYENTLSKSVVANKTINLVLLRFKHAIFNKAHLEATDHIPCFVFDKAEPVEREVERFSRFCLECKISVDYFYNDSEFNQEKVQKFAWLLNLPGALDEIQARYVRDKAIMKDKLQELGYRTMSYRELGSEQDALGFAKVHGFPFIVKWRKGMSAKEVYKIEDQKQLTDLGLDYTSRRFIAETYCPHLIWCFDSLVQKGRVAVTFPTWLPYTNLGFAEKKEKFAQITVKEYPDSIKFDAGKITQNLITELGLNNGYMQIEIFVDQCGQPIICEFAWRTAGEHMLLNQSLAYGIDVCSLLIDIVVGRSIPIPPITGHQCVGDMFLPLTDGLVTKISSYRDLENLEGVVGGSIDCKIGDVVKSQRQYTSCSGWIQVVGQTVEEVQTRMLNVYEKFEIVTA